MFMRNTGQYFLRNSLNYDLCLTVKDFYFFNKIIMSLIGLQDIKEQKLISCKFDKYYKIDFCQVFIKTSVMGTHENCLAKAILKQYPQHRFLWRNKQNYSIIFIKHAA